MKCKLIIYNGCACKTRAAEEIVESVEEIELMLNQYEGFWCQVVDMNKGKIILEGAFDDDFLDETYYQGEN